MIFKALTELYDRLANDPEYDVAPPGKSYQKVTFIVVLDRQGGLVDIQDGRYLKEGRHLQLRVLVLGDTKPPGAGLNPCFLWDTPGYLLGWDPENPARALRTFHAFRDRHLEVENEIGVPGFSAVCSFLKWWNPNRASKHPILEEVKAGYGVFQIQGKKGFVHDDPKIIAWWESQVARRQTGPPGQCLVTGRIGPIAKTHPKLKGINGALPGGATIAGLDDSAYWSYGLEQSYNAPVSEEAAHRYTTALNALLDGLKREKHRILIGGTTIAFWTDQPSVTEDIFSIFAADGSDAIGMAETKDETLRAKLKAFLKALREGREAYGELEEHPESTKYYILGLAAPTPARIAVRFFHTATIEQLLENLRRHHSDIGIMRRFGDDAQKPEPEIPSSGYLLRETASSRDNIPPLLPAKLLESIITGKRYPDALYGSVMRRISGDRIINYPRACMIKGHLVRNHGKEVPMSLDTNRNEPAYRLGRLFAALEKTQQDALGGNIGASIRDRFYASASATPSAVFPRLLRTYQHHLNKLEGGRKVNRERLVQEIFDPLAEVPPHFGLVDQGLFALGYYHQMSDLYRKKDDRLEEQKPESRKEEEQ